MKKEKIGLVSVGFVVAIALMIMLPASAVLSSTGCASGIPEVVSGKQMYPVVLYNGLNLIALPLDATDPTPDKPAQGPYYSAQDLINDINGDGGECFVVHRWVGSCWEGFYDGDPESGDFEIEIWKGYFVNCLKCSIWVTTGKVAERLTQHLNTGLNLIGISGEMIDLSPYKPAQSPYYSAQDLINDINADGGSAQAVSRWIATTGVWDTFNDGDPESLDFEVKRGEGYFVSCDEPSDWTP